MRRFGPLGQHKTSRFYGPVKTTVSPLIVPFLTRYLTCLEWDRQAAAPVDSEGGGAASAGGAVDSCYIFHPQGGDQRPHCPFTWAKVVKSV
jgi:hypothetical protein